MSVDRTGPRDAVRPARDGRVGIGLPGVAAIGVRVSPSDGPASGAGAWPLLLEAGGASGGAVPASAEGSAGSGLLAGAVPAASDSASPASATVRPVSNAVNPGGVQASAAACIAALTPTGGSPAAKAVSIASASAGFLYLDRAEAHARPNTVRAMSRTRALAIRDHSMSAVGRTWAAKSMSSLATVASSSGRAWGSKASCPFTVRATQAANRACLSDWGSARKAANDSPSSSISSQSKERPERSSSIASPGDQSENSASFIRVGGRSGVCLTAMSRAWS